MKNLTTQRGDTMETRTPSLLEALPDEVQCGLHSYLESDQKAQSKLVALSSRFYNLFGLDHNSAHLYHFLDAYTVIQDSNFVIRYVYCQVCACFPAG